MPAETLNSSAYISFPAALFNEPKQSHGASERKPREETKGSARKDQTRQKGSAGRRERDVRHDQASAIMAMPRGTREENHRKAQSVSRPMQEGERPGSSVMTAA